MPNERQGKGVDINVGDVITITRGNPYPPKEDKIAIVIDVLDFDVPDEKTLVVLWDDGMGEISSRRAKILDKNEDNKSLQNIKILEMKKYGISKIFFISLN